MEINLIKEKEDKIFDPKSLRIKIPLSKFIINSNSIWHLLNYNLLSTSYNIVITTNNFLYLYHPAYIFNYSIKYDSNNLNMFFNRFPIIKNELVENIKLILLHNKKENKLIDFIKYWFRSNNYYPLRFYFEYLLNTGNNKLKNIYEAIFYYNIFNYIVSTIEFFSNINLIHYSQSLYQFNNSLKYEYLTIYNIELFYILFQEIPIINHPEIKKLYLNKH